MSLIGSQFVGSRRPLAVGIWSFLVMLMPLTGTHVSSELSFWVLILVSVSCSVALLIVDDNRSATRSNPGLLRHIPVAISMVIATAWAILLCVESQRLVSDGPFLIGIAPVMIAAIWRMSQPVANVTPAREQRAEKACRTETANGASHVPIDEGLVEAVSTVPFYQPQLSIQDEFSEESERDRLDTSQPDDVTHWFTRSKTTNGEVIEGGIRVEFADGQRDVTVHISFCPSFAGIPTIDTEDLDGDGLEIRVAAVFPFGARLTVRRSGPLTKGHTPNSVRTSRIGFVAIAGGDVRRIA